MVVWRLRLAVGCGAAVGAALWLRARRRWQRACDAAHEAPRRLLADARVAACLLPYPAERTVSLLAAACRVEASVVRKLALDARNTTRTSFFYYVLHKPCGHVTSRAEGTARTVYDALPAGYPAVAHVGRLDRNTTGLLLFTDDGALSRGLLSLHNCDKTYLVHVRGADAAAAPRAAQLSSLAAPLDGSTRLARAPTVAAAARIAVVSEPAPGELVVRITIAEGKKHQVRRLCRRAGLVVVALHRAAFGPLDLCALPLGAARPLERHEVAACYAAAGLCAERQHAIEPLPVLDSPRHLARADLCAALLANLERRHAPGPRRSSAPKRVT
ncbi:pseudouridine synthase [Pelagophyceae sp. CCMP2097]|nr:pseudouridine synthase [Pelagophyceae sp. CCMP2097]